jgi:starvation-inducible DNA-binding protein
MKKTINELSIFLANTYLLTLKTQFAHWNVEGENFYSLHKLFEEHYNTLAEHNDELAERIRALKAFAPASFAEYQKLAFLKEFSEVVSADKMIATLMADHETMTQKAKELIDIAEKEEDPGTADMVTGFTEAHDKMAWMLRSLLKK